MEDHLYLTLSLSLVVADPFDYLGEGDVLPDISDLDSVPFALFRVGNDDDVPPFDASDPVALLTDILDLNSACLSLFYGRLR